MRGMGIALIVIGVLGSILVFLYSDLGRSKLACFVK